MTNTKLTQIEKSTKKELSAIEKSDKINKNFLEKFNFNIWLTQQVAWLKCTKLTNLRNQPCQGLAFVMITLEQD